MTEQQPETGLGYSSRYDETVPEQTDPTQAFEINPGVSQEVVPDPLPSTFTRDDIENLEEGRRRVAEALELGDDVGEL